MRIHVLSDLHLEFSRGGRFRLPKWPINCDVLVLAGDIGTGGMARQLIEQRTRFGPVLYILGNHEFYAKGKFMEDIRVYWQDLSKEIDNLHVLDNTHVDIAGYRFLGTTLWSNTSFGPPLAMNDFKVIDRGQFTQAHACDLWCENLLWLNDELQSSTLPCIVVTHHLPSYDCVEAQYKNKEFDHGYASDCGELLRHQNTKLWIHGHTHHSIDMEIDGTRVVCNPRGYSFEANKHFDPLKVITLV
jgi:Icc-related predicted phosphoesterase